MSKKPIQKTIFIGDLTEGQQIHDLFLVSRKNLAETKNGKPYLALSLMDRTGEIEARIWDNAARFDALAEIGQIIAIEGQVKAFRDQLQLSISSIVPLQDDDGQLGHFIPASKRSVKEMQQEPNIRVLAQLTDSISSSIDLLYRLRPQSGAALAEVLSVVEEDSWQRVTSEADPDRASLWFSLLLDSSSGVVARDRLRSLLEGSLGLPAVQLSEDLRWNILIALSSLGVSDYDLLLNTERERDPSDQGQKYAIAADASRPEASIKAFWLEQVADQGSELGLAKQRYAIDALFPANQTGLQAELLGSVLQSLPGLSDRDPYFTSSYVSGLLRPVCTEESVAAIAAALERGGLNTTSELFMREAHQADAECLALRVQMAK